MKCCPFILFIITASSLFPACKQKTVSSAQPAIKDSSPGSRPVRNIRDFSQNNADQPPFEVIRMIVNTDTVPDYFVVENAGLSFGSFYDGITGNEIPVDGVNHIWSRPGVELEYRIIDVDCGDDRKELLIRYGGGGTGGACYTTRIYRYDDSLKQVKMIFEETISDFGWGNNGEMITGPVNYIDVNYTKDSCVRNISVTKGKFIHGEKPFSLDIIPDKKSKPQLYRFNRAANLFERVP